jgi:hypothetical protein
VRKSFISGVGQRETPKVNSSNGNFSTARFGENKENNEAIPVSPINRANIAGKANLSPPSKIAVRESIVPEPFEDTLEKEDLKEINKINHKEPSKISKRSENIDDFDDDRDDDDNDFDEERSRSDPFDTESEEDCLSRGSALSDFTEYANTKLEECRPSEAPTLVLAKNVESPDRDI